MQYRRCSGRFFPRISLTSTVGTGSTICPGFQGDLQPGALPSNNHADFDTRLWSGLKGVKVEREIAVAQYREGYQMGF
jgi:hypothetical protein